MFFSLQRRLCSAAKKALSKIPTKNIKSEDKVSAEIYTPIVTLARVYCGQNCAILQP
jgi:hypothetical protein